MSPASSNVLIGITFRLAVVAALDIRCPNGDFTHALPGTSCHQYYVCRGPHNKVERHMCPTGTHFVPEFKACKVGGHCYDLVCTGRVDGRYADTTEICSRWYECRGGNVVRLESCLEGHQFSEEHGDCVLAQKTGCSQPKSTAGLVGRTLNPCYAQEDGFIAIGDAPVYVRCHNHEEMETHACLPGQLFDGRSCRDQNDCSGKRDGYHMVEDTNCKEYSLCKNKRLILRSKCPSGSAFDGASCVPRRIVACPQKNKCSGLPDGVYPNMNNHCQSYYHCRDGKMAKIDSCPNGLIWNGQHCLPKESSNCVESTSSVECYGITGYISDTSDCKNYHYCNHGTKMSFTCPHGKVYNGYRCAPSQEYTCPERINNFCENRAPGYYTDLESNCRSYFYCANSNKITYVCAPNEVFNGVECVPKEAFECPHVNAECSKRPNGYQRKERSPQEYIYCADGVKLATLQCEHNKVYDGERCVSVNQLTNACHKVRYGYITDETCRLYYVCRDDNVVKSGVCKDDFMFNGKSCIRKTSGKCDRGSLKSCSGAPNGFFQDFNANCQKYFYCINGEKTALSCPQGQVHNGDICVPNHRFVCPSVKITESLKY